MISIKLRIFTTLVLSLSLVSAALGQQATTTPAPAAKSPDYVEEKGFKVKVLEVKHRDPATLLQAVAQLGSGFKGAKLSSSYDFKIITIRDFPENIAAIEEAVRRLDTPEASRPDIELRIHVLIASNTAADDYPAELNDVVKQLQSALKY